MNATIPGYAQYIADVLSHWRSQGVRITYVSPMNEPDDVNRVYLHLRFRGADLFH